MYKNFKYICTKILKNFKKFYFKTNLTTNATIFFAATNFYVLNFKKLKISYTKISKKKYVKTSIFCFLWNMVKFQHKYFVQTKNCK